MNILLCTPGAHTSGQVSVVVTYRLFLHPLAKYPGPFWARVTNWYAVYHAYIGNKHLQNYWAHQKYGMSVLQRSMALRPENIALTIVPCHRKNSPSCP